MTKKKTLSQLEKLLSSLVSTPKRLENFLTVRKSQATKHLPDKEKLIEKVFKRCMEMFQNTVVPGNRILSTLGSLQKNKWMTFLDKLNTCVDLNILTTFLFKTLVQESILSEKDYVEFWTPAYKEMSEKLWLPTETGYVDLDLNSSNRLLQNQVEKLQSLTVTHTPLHNQNLLKTCLQSSISSHVDKWGEEATLQKEKNLRTIMLKLKPTETQIKLIEEIFDVTRYLYNKTNALLKKDISLRTNKQDLRDKFVTKETKKGRASYINSLPELEKNYFLGKETLNENEKLFYSVQRLNLFKKQKEDLKKEKYKTNPEIRDFEKRVSKTIRDNAVRNACSDYISAVSNLKNGNIKFFNISYKKKSSPRKCAELSKNDIKMVNSKIQISPSFLGEHCTFKLGKRNTKKYGKCLINNHCDLIKRNSGYYIGLLLPVDKKENSNFKKICGIDPGVRTFLTSYGTEGVKEYKHDEKYLEKLDKLLKTLKKRKTKRLRKKTLTKIDKKKENFINDLHWKTINTLLKEDVIFFGDIKSHGISKNGKNRTLNRRINNLKFFVFKQRLKYKAELLHKKVVFVNEAFTTQCCSKCGNLWKEIGTSEIYNCVKCKTIYGRDINSAKNILMKGLLS